MKRPAVTTKLILSVIKVARGDVAKISSFKDAEEKAASTYATAAATGSSKLCAQIEQSGDLTSALIIEKADASFKNSVDIKQILTKCSLKKKLLFAFRTSGRQFYLEFDFAKSRWKWELDGNRFFFELVYGLACVKKTTGI